MNDDDLLGEVSEEERAAAEAMAQALEKPAAVRPGTDAAFALALRATQNKVPLDEAVEDRAIEKAIETSRRARRSRTWGPLLLAAAVLLLAVPATSRLNDWLTAPVSSETSDALPTADQILAVPPPDDQRPAERLSILSRARARSYFSARMTSERGAR
jgi:hypothetical protein